MSPPDPSDLTIACHVRPSLVFDPIDAKIETLRTCEREGRIDALLLRSWPGEVALADAAPHEAVRDRVAEFERWADDAGVSISPPFDRRETTSVAATEPIERLVTPTMCLACYHDDRLVGVFPHTDDETTHTVPEAIAALRTGELPAPLREYGSAEVADPLSAGEESPGALDLDVNRSSGDRRSSAERCPECDGRLVNVQGLRDCPGCSWRAVALERRPATVQ